MHAPAPIVLYFPEAEFFAITLSSVLGAQASRIEMHRFPDGESMVRIDEELTGRDIIIACSLVRPDEKVLPLLFAADTARELGRMRVFLVAPYLAYMRQDKRFHAGEAITSKIFARLLSSHIDGLITVDPHLHRYQSLSEIYQVPTRVVHAASALARWIQQHVNHALVIGPDSESEQWVSEVASGAGVPFVVLQKTRHGDRQVDIDVPDFAPWSGRTPVIIDDIVSSARTMIEVCSELRRQGIAAPICVAVHALFADDAYDRLIDAGAGQIISCDTIEHASNQISLVEPVAAAVLELLKK